MYDIPTLAAYFGPLLLVLLIYTRRRQMRLRVSAEARAEAIDAGLTEPASLHPLIKESVCIGCAACADACPEMPGHTVIGIVNGKAELVSPTDCIGHGACQAACPVGAIELVFGTEKRGVDIPTINPDFQTNIPGIYIAGELGGMGLIRNAIEQGRQAMESIARTNRKGKGPDVLVIGAGPAGFAASLAAMEHKLSYVTVEQENLGGTVAHFPRGKLVMTTPAELPIYGKMRFRETSKEKLLEFWQNVQNQTGLTINFDERVESIDRMDDGSFRVITSRETYHPANILLCLGRRGTPRKLGVPGEDLPKVTYRLIEPEQYHGMSVLVVGGGDSAIEAACALAESDNIDVTLSYRSEAFTRVKAKNREALELAQEKQQLSVLLNSTVQEILPDKVVLQQDEDVLFLANDAIIVNAGGILPTAFLQSIGIEINTKYGTR